MIFHFNIIYFFKKRTVTSHTVLFRPLHLPVVAMGNGVSAKQKAEVEKALTRLEQNDISKSKKSYGEFDHIVLCFPFL